MERHLIPVRPNWEAIVQAQGLTFHLTDGRPYWDESACYVFTQAEIDAIEVATYRLNEMCLAAVEHVVQDHSDALFRQFLVPDPFVKFVRESWERDEQTVYGRFDLACDGTKIKMLEYNADTPTGLIEAAVTQWYWLEDTKRTPPETGNAAWDQFNSVHDRLVEAWQAVGATLSPNETMYFTSIDDQDEDFMTVHYLRDTAMQAGLQTKYLDVADIGWSGQRGAFVDKQMQPIRHCFKLYPWEWMVRERFGPHLLQNTVRWLEAPWKMLLSNKALLPLLWSLYPDSPYLLPAYHKNEAERVGRSYVRKPLLGREGANTMVVIDGKTAQETDGPYSGPFVYQEYTPLPDFGGNYPVVGSWMVNGWACGIGIREESRPITTNQARFVPHRFQSIAAG